jgi:hypothetical protein
MTGISIDGVDTLDFVNIFQASGVFFALDYARKERTGLRASADWTLSPEQKTSWGEDFKAGDKIMLKTTGGALGFPLPGAKVKARLPKAEVPQNDLSDKDLDQISIVPNPYYITHQGQKSPYDAKIYFTRLPKTCTIDIYTVTGDLVMSLKHDVQVADPEKEAIEHWNLLSSNKQRVQSQTFIAVISTPNGAQTIKKFTVVVGGFRLIDESSE